MNGFIRTLIYGLAAIAVVLLAGGVTMLAVMRGNGTISPEKVRSLVLSPEELAWLEAMKQRKDEPAESRGHGSAGGHGDAGVDRPADEEALLTHIAELANASRATQFVAELKRTRQSLDENRILLDRQASEVQQARAELIRLQARLLEREQALAEREKALSAEQARWAGIQADAQAKVNVLGEAERARLRDQAKLFEQMKDNAWLTLRRMEPREIAGYLAVMDGKKAARLLVIAAQDAESPGIALAIHRELMRVDLKSKGSDTIQFMAQLYAFMPAEQVMGYLATATAQEIADVLTAMGQGGGQLKKRAEILERLRTSDPKRELEVERILAADKPVAALNPQPAVAPGAGSK